MRSYAVLIVAVITPNEKTLPTRLNMLLIQELQTFTAPDVFQPPAVYDGRKNMFAIAKLPFDGAASKDVCHCFISLASLLSFC